MVAGLAFLHGRKIIHRRVTPANVLVTTAGDIKLTHFASAKLTGDDNLGESLASGGPK